MTSPWKLSFGSWVMYQVFTRLAAVGCCKLLALITWCWI